MALSRERLGLFSISYAKLDWLNSVALNLP